ncbi:phosphopantothenate--cysteine ligase-like [Babylonia areolata]|uniref:phosphopantothenate--cysteine ligase-like n=1 Tax=Babylonia areolata TaxID=304850 RepID=UPI003FD463CC
MSATEEIYDDFFENTALPDHFEEKKNEIESFIKFHEASQERIVLVTSGGTTVPLESRTVRFIDNFSIGTRGSASAEYFLGQGYLVIFLHRLRSLTPFHRHVQSNILDHLTVSCSENECTITVKSQEQEKLLSVLQQYESAKSKRRLLSVSFTSLGDYLHLLRATCRLLAPLGSRAMLYLAAAVSDFYIPADKMPEHKIQSSEKPLQLSLQLVPKMLKPLVKDWLPDAFVVSFKLETDKAILIQKARKSLEQYQHKVVVANVLDTRKMEVVLVTMETEQTIRLSAEEASSGKEIEETLIKTLMALHDKFCHLSQQS